uniref:VRR-NUC domain-containing protein n=1 Tax=viral metagenome TaxID=1070528 RepID=A0A6M3JK99_9ZZZZ
MTRWSEEEYQKFKLRQEQLAPSPRDMAYHDLAGADEADESSESNLQRKAEAWLKERGYPYIHDRSRGKNRPGMILDLHIYLPKGRHVVIELKAKGEKLTTEQKETYQKIMFLGHEIYECKSWKRFLQIVCGEKNDSGKSNQAQAALKPEKGSWVKGGLVW